MTPLRWLILPLLLLAGPACADDAPAATEPEAIVEDDSADGDGDEADAIAAFDRSLHFQTGAISLPGGFASLNLSPNFRFLDAQGAKRVLVEAWGNPPEAAQDVLGMIFPADVSPVESDGWGVVITYEKDGYVKDSDADSIDYKALLKDMQEATKEQNDQRRSAGYATAELIGWAQPPYYDKTAHKLHWAKELRFSGTAESTLNYDIRVLGRYGVLSLNAVAGMNQLGLVNQSMQEVLAVTEFSPGHRYADFSPGADRYAPYGLAALVAGGVAAKMGLFAKIGALLLSMKKLIILAGAAVVGVVGKLLKGRSQSTA
jgi:uncharacterized membrane-anchored protein